MSLAIFEEKYLPSFHRQVKILRLEVYSSTSVCSCFREISFASRRSISNEKVSSAKGWKPHVAASRSFFLGRIPVDPGPISEQLDSHPDFESRRRSRNPSARPSVPGKSFDPACQKSRSRRAEKRRDGDGGTANSTDKM